MNATNIINLYKTWYKDIDIVVSKNLDSLVVKDFKTGSTYYINSIDMITRTFSDLGNMRKACNVL